MGKLKDFFKGFWHTLTTPIDELLTSDAAKDLGIHIENPKEAIVPSREPTFQEVVRMNIPELSFLSDRELEKLIDEYYGDWSLIDIRNDVDTMLAALSEQPVRPEMPTYDETLAPNYTQYVTDARAEVDAENQAMLTDLDSLLNTQRKLYDEQMASYDQRLEDISNQYSGLRSNILSQQHQQTAQLMDTLQSGMERSRRNALESGASAGIRIADNINTLLSVQNKQSASAMETANQLAQMMVQQRNAENSVTDAMLASRQGYANALAEDTSKRHSITTSTDGRVSDLAFSKYNSAFSDYTNKYNAAMSDYNAKNTNYEQDKQNWDSKYAYNPLYQYRSRFSK